MGCGFVCALSFVRASFVRSLLRCLPRPRLLRLGPLCCGVHFLFCSGVVGLCTRVAVPVCMRFVCRSFVASFLGFVDLRLLAHALPCPSAWLVLHVCLTLAHLSPLLHHCIIQPTPAGSNIISTLCIRALFFAFSYFLPHFFVPPLTASITSFS